MPNNATPNTAPLNPHGPLCKFLRSPNLLYGLFSQLPRDKQRRTLELLGLVRQRPLTARTVVERLLDLLDTFEGRTRFSNQIYSLPKLLIEQVEQNSSYVVSRFKKHLHVPKTQIVTTKAHRRIPSHEPIEGAKRSLHLNKLTSQEVTKILSDASQVPFVITYIIGFALGQPSSAEHLCRPFLAESPEFREALLGPYTDLDYSDEYAAIEGTIVLAASSAESSPLLPAPLTPASSLSPAQKTIAAAAEELGMVRVERPATDAPLAVPAGPPVATKLQDSLIPQVISAHLEEILQQEQLLGSLFSEKNFDRLSHVVPRRDKAIDSLRKALAPYYQQLSNFHGVALGFPDNVRNHESIEPEVSKLFHKLADARRQKFEHNRHRLLDRLKNLGLLHLWVDVNDNEALSALEKRLDPQLQIHEAAADLLWGRVAPGPAALCSLSNDARVAAAEIAVRQAMQQIGAAAKVSLDLEPLLRFMHQSGICRERSDLALDLLGNIGNSVQGRVSRGILIHCIHLAFATAKALPGRTGWHLLFTVARLGPMLAHADGPVLDLLSSEYSATDSQVLRLWAQLAREGARLDALPASIAEHLYRKGHAEEAIRVLAGWMYGNTSLPIEAREKLLPRLRDYLFNNQRQGEAVLLVARAVRAGHRVVAAGFESPMTEYLLGAANRCDSAEAKQILETALEVPAWLLHQPSYGSVAFLYVCHLADLGERVINIRYQYPDVFDKARRHHPILVGEFFLGVRFATSPDAVAAAASDASRMLEQLSAFRTGLLKRSCYSAWPSAENYQRYFNARLEKLFEHLDLGSDPQPLQQILEMIDPEQWIEEANRKFGTEVHHPALELMTAYISEQSSHLRQLARARKEFGTDEPLGEQLKAKARSLTERIRSERATYQTLHPIVERIYSQLAESSS